MLRSKIEFHGGFATSLAICTTIFFMCIENVKAFMSSQTMPTVFCNLLQTSSMAAWISRFPTSVRKMSDLSATRDDNVMSFAASSIQSFLTKAQQASKTTTSLAASWSFNDMASFSMTTLNSASLAPFGSWYNEIDPRVRSPVYEDATFDYTTFDYTFSSPSDNWPSLYDDDDDNLLKPVISPSSPKTKEELFRPPRIRPIRALRLAATRALRVLPMSIRQRAA